MPLQSDKLRLLRRIPDIRFDEEASGFSRDQVNRVLANLAPLADEIERLQSRLAEAEDRAAAAEARLVEARSPSSGAENASAVAGGTAPDFDETLRKTLVSAQRQADLTVSEANEEAERLRTEAEFQSNAMLADARDQSAEMTTEATRYREQLMAEAAEERSQRLEDARKEAQGLVDDVNSELVEAHEAERARLIEQIEALEGQHSSLQETVTKFEEHLKSRTDEVRSAVERIVETLDNPEVLRAEETFEAPEVEALERDEFSPIGVEVSAMDELEATAAEAAEVVEGPAEPIPAEEFDELATIGDDSELLEVVEAESEFDSAPESADEHDDDPEPSRSNGSILGIEAAGDDLGEAGMAIPVPELPSDNDVGLLEAAEMVQTAPNGDPFLEELRRVTDEEPASDDAISEFFDDKPRQDRGAGGWFGRRR